MIAFASLVIEPKHPLPIQNINRSVLETMFAGRYRLRQLPNHELEQRAIGVHVFETVISLAFMLAIMTTLGQLSNHVLLHPCNENGLKTLNIDGMTRAWRRVLLQ